MSISTLNIIGGAGCLPVCNSDFLGTWTGNRSGLCTGINPEPPGNLCDYDGLVVYLGNENAIADDDIEIRLNGMTVATYIDELPSGCTGSCGGTTPVCPTAVTTLSSPVTTLINRLDEIINSL